MHQCQVQIPTGSSVEERACAGRTFLWSGTAEQPRRQYPAAEEWARQTWRRRECGGRVRARPRGRIAASQQILRLGLSGNARCVAQRATADSAGARTLQTDFAKMQFVRGEIGIGGIVFVKAADRGITKQDASTAVGLKAVFMRIDDDGVDRGQRGKRIRCICV